MKLIILNLLSANSTLTPSLKSPTLSTFSRLMETKLLKKFRMLSTLMLVISSSSMTIQENSIAMEETSEVSTEEPLLPGLISPLPLPFSLLTNNREANGFLWTSPKTIHPPLCLARPCIWRPPSERLERLWHSLTAKSWTKRREWSPLALTRWPTSNHAPNCEHAVCF